MAPSAPAVRVDGVVKHYPSVTALRGVSLEIGQGEVFGLLGPNGAGKTTLIRIMLGLARPSAGRIELFGRPVPQGLPDVAPLVGVVFDNPAFYPHLSAFDNLRIFAWTAGLRPSGGELHQVLERVGLGEVGGRRVRGFSAGMRQRLALAAALLGRPRLLVLDEPTAALDPVGVLELRSILREVAAGGCGILLSSHQLREVEALSQRVLLLHRGREIRSGALSELMPSTGQVVVRHDQPLKAARYLAAHGFSVDEEGDRGALVVSGAEPEDVLRALVRGRLHPQEVASRRPSLEDVFAELYKGTGGEGD